MAVIELNDATGEVIGMAGYGLLFAAGLVVPPNGSSGYAHGGIFAKVNGTTGADAHYVNVGTITSSTFEALPLLSAFLNQPNGIAGLNSSGNLVVDNIIPMSGTAAEIDVVLLPANAIAIVDGVSIRIGDGVTLGGNPLELEA